MIKKYNEFLDITIFKEIFNDILDKYNLHKYKFEANSLNKISNNEDGVKYGNFFEIRIKCGILNLSNSEYQDRFDELCKIEDDSANFNGRGESVDMFGEMEDRMLELGYKYLYPNIEEGSTSSEEQGEKLDVVFCFKKIKKDDKKV